MNLVLAYTILTYSTILVDSISVLGLIDPASPNSPILTQFPSEKKLGVKSEGIFERFLRRGLEVLSTRSGGKNVIKFCRLVSKDLNKLKYSDGARLAMHFSFLSRMYREDLRNQLAHYRGLLDEKLPNRQLFLLTMNEAFTIEENGKFDQYIKDLSDYIHGRKPSIDGETTKLINEVILYRIEKMDQRKKRELGKQMRAAYKEYSHD